MKNAIDEKFCEHIAKLFYAIACVDKRIEKVEYDVFKSKMKSIDELFNYSELKVDVDMYYHITSTFNMLYLNQFKSHQCFEDFIFYLKNNSHQFPKSVRIILLKIAGQIAASYSGQNKSELIFLAKLSIEFKKL
ncbi:hypothetical protein [Psychroserpens sp.]|uniref:hypothetical protein n=1 Tax=Psychroserpens sp. TaxID=2020870 RepID=UPI00385A0E1C